MHYRHAYHAGNFADVHKHLVLLALVRALARKPKPFAYLETHAGAGLYDLGSAAAQTTGESATGVRRLQNLRDAPDLLARYLAILHAANSNGELRHYPGSPLFARAEMRADDRLILCESVPEIADELRLRVSQALVHVRDGYQAHALLPPAEKRGLVLVDAPFERRDEFAAMTTFLREAQSRFSGGVYAFWYPLKNSHEVERFTRRIGEASSKPVLDFRFETGAAAEGQMRGSGVVVVNPPYQVADELGPSLTVLAQLLAQGPRAAATTTWLKAE